MNLVIARPKIVITRDGGWYFAEIYAGTIQLLASRGHATCRGAAIDALTHLLSLPK